MNAAKPLKNQYHALNKWLEGRDNFLVVAHQRPDGDAFGSAFAVNECLKLAGLNTVVYMEGELPDNIKAFAIDDYKYGNDRIDLDKIDNIGFLHRGQTVGNYQRGAALHELTQ